MTEEPANLPQANDQANEPTQPGPPSQEMSTSTAQESDKDELEKLQKEKLKAEIADLKKPLWKKITFWPPVLTFAISLFVYAYLFQTGTFDAKQAHLTYVTDTLRIFKDRLYGIVESQKDTSRILSTEILQHKNTIDSLHQKIDILTNLIRQYDSALKLKDSTLSKQNAHSAALLRQIESLQNQQNELQRVVDFYSPFAERSYYSFSSDCRPADVSKIPGNSGRSRYFRMDLSNSFMLNSRGFQTYLAQHSDGYYWDSIKQCQGKYVVYFTKGPPYQFLPYSAGVEFSRHSIAFLDRIGILHGKYDLLFDFEQNQSSDVVPSEDIGRWNILGNPNRVIILRNNMIEFGDSGHLQQFRIDHIKVDLVDHSELYFAHEQADNSQQQFLIKHGLSWPIILYAPGSPETETFYIMSKL